MKCRLLALCAHFDRYDDDITQRPFSVGYITSNCVPHREELFRLLRDRLGEKEMLTGRCVGTGAQVPGHHGKLVHVTVTL